MIQRDTVRLHQSRHTTLAQGQRLAMSAAHRRCQAEGCDTRLSRYNPSSTCTLHQGWSDTRQRRYD